MLEYRGSIPGRVCDSFFLFATASRPVLRLAQSSIQWVTGVLFPRVKCPEREADHSPPFSAEVKSEWSYTYTPQYVFMAWYLVKHRENLPCIFTKRKREQNKTLYVLVVRSYLQSIS
jgi:hypothetical protein